MKKAVITILGIQNPKYDDAGLPHVSNYNHQARYYFENNAELPPSEYFNTLPLLINQFSETYEIVPLYTEAAKSFNEEVLEISNLECSFHDEKSKISDESDYLSIFSKIDTLMNAYDSVIIDLTHGFRHLPLLVIVDLVIQNFKTNKKIEHIFFAKEIIKHTPSVAGEYEIVDLKEYLDIANIAYVLSTFEQNYTISKNIRTNDDDFQRLINMLTKFSEQIMANSLLNLFVSKDSLISSMLTTIDVTLEQKKSQPLKPYLTKISIHLKELKLLSEQTKYIQLFELSKIMNKKGYYLNAITLLNESVSWYCAERLRDYSEEFNKNYQKLKNKHSYSLVSHAKNIVKFTFSNGNYENKLDIHDIKSIETLLLNIDGCDGFAKKMLQEVDKLRNNLAHANSDKRISDVEKEFQVLFSRFQSYCIDKDILKKKDATLNDLKSRFNG